MNPTTPSSGPKTPPSLPTSSQDSNFDGIIKIVLPIFAIIASFALFPLQSAITLSALIALVAFTMYQCTNNQPVKINIDPTPKTPKPAKTKPPVPTSEKLENVKSIHFRPATRIHFSPGRAPKIIETIMTYWSPNRNPTE